MRWAGPSKVFDLLSNHLSLLEKPDESSDSSGAGAYHDDWSATIPAMNAKVSFIVDLLRINDCPTWITGVGIVGLSILAASLLGRKKSGSSPATSGHGLPPSGPTFAEFFPDGMKTENQEALVAKHGDVFTIPSPLPGIVPTQVVINEPNLVKDLCVRQSNMYRPPSNFTTRGDAFARATRTVVGAGVTGLKGEEWSWRKRAILKEFHRNRLLSDERGLLSVIVDEGRRMCDALGDAADKGTVVRADYLATEAAVGVVLFFLFGRRLAFDAAEFRQAAEDMIESLFFLLTNPLYPIARYVPGTASYKIRKRLKRSQVIIDRVVASEIDLLLEEYHGTTSVHPDRAPGSVIASLISNEPRFRRGGTTSMLAEARVFVQAGFETTAHSLAFAMGMLAERPDLADEIARQGREMFASEAEGGSYYDNLQLVKEAVGGGGGHCGKRHIALVGNFFYEALRKYPLAPSLGGECTNDIDIVTRDGTQYTLPRGTFIAFLNYTLQRKVPEPEEIRPERWDASPEDQPFLHTFQNGPHMCPGKPLSLLEGRVFLLLAAMQFEFAFPEGVSRVEYKDELLLRPKDSMPLLVKRR